MKRFLLWLLVAALLVPCILTGCKKDEAPEEPTTEVTTLETTLGEDEKPDVPPEGWNELTSVSISMGESPAEQTAGNDLKKYLLQKGVSVQAAGGFPITLSIDETLGDDAYRATVVTGEEKTEGISIVGGNGRGILYGVYAFLEKYANVRFFTPDLEVCNPGWVAVPDGVLLDYTPSFELRQTDWYKWKTDGSGNTWAAKSGINIVSGWSSSWGEELGGSLTYAPSLFVHTIGKLAETKVKYPATAPTPCLTDETIYNTVLSNVLKALEANPDVKILSVSQNDNPEYCTCESCAAIIAEEGSPAGPILRFVNRIANAVAPLYPDVTIDTLAYDYSLPAPKLEKPAKNVCIRLCTINCHFNHAISKTRSCYNCSQFSAAMENWGKICDNLYVWDYTTNYRHFLATFPNFHVMRDNMSFFAANNVKGVYEQGNASGPSGEFGELRAYLIGKLLMNPYMTKSEYDTHMKEFLAAYYGAGWKNIYSYIDSYGQYAKLATSGMGIYSSPMTVLSQNGLTKMKDTFNGYWDAAEAAAGDRLEYVQRSRWQLRYLLLFAHPDKEEATKLVEAVEGNKVYWRENWPKLLWYVEEYDLLQKAPDKWFIDPSKEE